MKCSPFQSHSFLVWQSNLSSWLVMWLVNLWVSDIVNFCWKIFFFLKEIGKKKVVRKNSNFVLNSQNPQAVWGLCLQDRYMLGEKTENSLLYVLALKHRLLNSLEFQKEPFSFRKYCCMMTATIQRWHCTATLPWNGKQKRRNGSKQNVNFLYTFPPCCPRGCNPGDYSPLACFMLSSTSLYCPEGISTVQFFNHTPPTQLQVSFCLPSKLSFTPCDTGITCIKCMFFAAAVTLSRPPPGLMYLEWKFSVLGFNLPGRTSSCSLSAWDVKAASQKYLNLGNPNAKLRQAAVSHSNITRLSNIAFPAWASPEGWDPGGAVRACRTYQDKGTALTKQHGSCHVCCKTWPEQCLILYFQPFPFILNTSGISGCFSTLSWMFAQLNLLL